jgi:superfamily I DNA and RNA helicase
MNTEIFINSGYRGSGRTTMMLREIKEYAIEHPDHRIMVYAHDYTFAKTLESWYRKLGMDTKNVYFKMMPEDMERVNERMFDKYFIDHHAEELYWNKIIGRATSTLERIFG